jgi:adenylate cyclase
MKDPVILVVDDSEDNRFTLSMHLEVCGYGNIVQAENGREALDKLRINHIDLILLDIMMPELDGYGVLQEMRSDIALREIPVVVVSAIEDMQSVVRCLELGALDYLTKPFNPVLLKARVNNCVNKMRFKEQEALYLEKIERQKRRADELLATLLPKPIVRALKLNSHLAPRRYEDVTVLFCDVVGFTTYSEQHPPEIVFATLESLIERFEQLTQKHGLEKIKTVGDAFMATAGLLSPHDNAVPAAVACAFEMIETAKDSAGWTVRVGIDHGPVSAGIMGKTQYQFDVWGDTVNTAARIEGYSRPGTVSVSGRAWLHLRSIGQGRSCGLVDLKGKEKIEVIECIKLL